MRKLSHILIVFCVVFCVVGTLAAADATIHGVVTDAAGKPVRGAVVKATAGNLSVSGYSQNDGRYEISVPAGTYSVTADAFGFTSKSEDKVVAQAGETNFKLSPRIDVTRLTGAEVLGLLPDDSGTSVTIPRRASPSAKWTATSLRGRSPAPRPRL